MFYFDKGNSHLLLLYVFAFPFVHCAPSKAAEVQEKESKKRAASGLGANILPALQLNIYTTCHTTENNKNLEIVKASKIK